MKNLFNETVVSHDELLIRAKELGELAEEYALEADENRRLPDVVIEKMKEAEFHKLLRPKEYGGSELDFHTFGEIIRTVAYHNMPAAWITYFSIIHETWAAYLPKEGRDELFNSGGLMADVLAPVGKVEDAPDGKGYLLSGQWNFCSGVLWSDWIGLGAIHQLRDGDKPEFSLFIINKKDAEIIDNWDTHGLRGTGSQAVKVENVYIPEKHIFKASRTMAGATAADGNYDEDYIMFNVPFIQAFVSGFPNVIIGGLERLVDDFKHKTMGRVRVYNNNKNEKDGSASQRAIGEITMEFNALKSVADDYLESLNEYRKNGKNVLAEEERERLFAMRGYVAKNGALLATKILITLGGNSLYRNSHSERFVRDINAVASHPTSLYEDSMQGYGKTIIGLDGHPTW